MPVASFTHGDGSKQKELAFFPILDFYFIPSVQSVMCLLHTSSRENHQLCSHSGKSERQNKQNLGEPEDCAGRLGSHW
jgi:hypothetical protein